ncbi:MAG TPA: RNA polymerase sigma factor SigJ [Acidimicrobiia bacterium]|nr:RNA polymerase sigma factor SigJ [Acidimicrobiia bacterium]
MDHSSRIDIEGAWHAHRRRVFDVAYRMLGSVSEAEDVAQEAYVRLLRVGLDGIDDPLGWLITVTARLSLDHLRSSHARRVSYVGPWLPEPLVDSGSAFSPEERVTLDESVRMALLVVLETLSPAERTALVLHDVFGVPFEAVAELVGRSPEACRQLASRARRRVADSDAAGRFKPSRSQLARTAEEFANACASGSFEALLRILDPEVAGTFDSGGHVPGAPAGPVRGDARVARVILRSFRQEAARFNVVDVNGEPGVAVIVGNEIRAVVSLSLRDDKIVHIDAVGNPDKLSHLK